MSRDSSIASPHPLAGVRVFSARTSDSVTPMARGLHEALAAAGAEIVDVSLVQTVLISTDTWSLTPQIWARYAWVCVTSGVAVEVLATALASTGVSLGSVQTVVVGAGAHDSATLRGWHITVDVPDVAVGVGAQTTAVVAAVMEALLSRDDVADTRMLLLTSEELSSALSHGFDSLSVTVQTVVVTRTEPVTGLAQRMTALSTAMVGQTHPLLVTSPSAVDLLTDAIAPEKTGRFPMLCIGKQTARAARTAGFPVTLEMEYANGPALVRRMMSAMVRNPLPVGGRAEGRQ